MPTLSKRPAALRETWRLPNRPRGYVRHLRRWLVTVLTIVLLACLGYLLFSPFFHPNSRLLLLTAGQYDVPGAPPIKYAEEDLSSFQSLRAAVLHMNADRPGEFRELESAETLTKLADELAASDIRPSDALIMYISAHGVAFDGQTFLLCQDFGATAADDGRYQTAKLLQHISQSRAAIKLLILDTGHLVYDPGLGVIVNEFPRLLRQEVEQVADSSLWVINSNSELETSRNSRGLARSVFGHFVALGLKGGADLNADQFIGVDELYRFVRANVSAWVQTTSQNTYLQTPTLLRGGGADPLANCPVLLSVSQLQAAATEESPAQDGDQPPAVDAANPEVLQGTSPDSPTSKAAAASNDVAENGSGDADQAASDQTATAQESTEQASVEDEPDGAPLNKSAVESIEDELPFAADIALTAEQSRIEEAWRLSAAVNDRDIKGPNPIDYAPHLWRELLEYIRAYSARLVDATDPMTDSQEQWSKDFRRLVSALREMESVAPLTQPSPHRIIERLRDHQLRPELSTEKIQTLGLRERIARLGGRPLSKTEASLLETLDQVILADDRKPFDEWISKSWDSSFDRFLELRIARQLAEQQWLDWPVIRQVLSCYRLGEQVAADPGCRVQWIRRRVEQGDRYRMAATRSLLDGVGSDFMQRGRSRLSEAIREYELADQEIWLVRESNQLRNSLLLRLRDYVCLRQAASEASMFPRQQDIMSLIQTVAEICQAIDHLDQATQGQLRGLTDRALAMSQQIEAELLRTTWDTISRNPDDNSGIAAAYLLSSLPSDSIRRRLSLAVRQSNQELPDEVAADELSGAVPLPQVLTPRDWKVALGQLELEIAIAGIAALHPRDDENAFLRLEQAYAEIVAPDMTSESELIPQWEGHRKVGSILRQFYQTLPGRIENAMRDSGDLSRAETRQEHLARLMAAQRALHVMDPRDNRHLNARGGLEALQHAELHDLLRWHATRFRLAQRDVPTDDLVYARQAASQCRLLANSLPQQPVVPPDEVPTLSLDGPPTGSLVANPELSMRLTVNYRGTSEAPSWVLIQYDPELLKIESRPAANVYREHDLRSVLRQRAIKANERLEVLRTQPDATRETASIEALQAIRQSAEHPYLPNVAGLTSTFIFRPGESRHVDLTVRARSKTAVQTKLILKAICGHEYLRHEALLRLPGRGRFVLRAMESQESWSRTDEGLALHPIPRHESIYRLSLSNDGRQNASVAVEVLAAQSALSTTIPRHPLTPAALEDLFAQLPPLNTLYRIDKLELPGDGSPVQVRIQAAPDGDGADASAGQAAIAANDNEAEPGAPKQPVSVRHGLVVVVTDLQLQQHTLWRVDFRPRRPRRYLEAFADYDANRERLSIRVTPRDPSLVPPDGFRIECEFPDPLPRGTEARLKDVVAHPRLEAQFYADLPLNASRVETVYLHVDDYPRAFIFRIPLWRTSRSVPEANEQLGVRILQPQAGAAFPPSSTTIPLALRVDAPLGTFDSGSGIVEAGIDVDRDREFRDDATLKLYSDRQAKVWFHGLNAAGAMTFHTEVGDFMLAVPVGSFQNARVNLLAKVQVGAEVRWSEPVEIILDQSGPQIERVQLNPNRIILQGAEIEVRARAGDDDLSGVERVEVGLDLVGTGEFTEGNTPIEAARDSAGVWTAKVPAAATPGPVTLLVQAIDRVGNRSEIETVDLRIVTEEELEAIRRAATNRVYGRVQYAGDPVPNAELTLTGAVEVEPVTSSETGHFNFPAVVPGKYKLAARGIARNKPRTAEMEIIVKPAPSSPLRLRIDLQ